MSVESCLEWAKSFNPVSSGEPTIEVRITGMRYTGESTKIEMKTDSGEVTTGELSTSPANNELAKIMDNSKKVRAEEIVGDNITVSLSQFPRFARQFESVPPEIVASVVNHPTVAENSDTVNKNQSLETLLYKRFRAIDGISEDKAKRMAQKEALASGELSSLLETSKRDRQKLT